MGPFSTYFEEFAEFGADARRVAKENRGDPNFWFLAVVSALYFSGIVHDVNYICPFPGHNPAATGGIRDLLDDVMSRFSKCFRKPYLPDLIVRHTRSQKSQYLKAQEKTFLNHLNTIHLNQRPRSYNNLAPRKTPLPLAGKRVLVVGDFITNGRSLDAARAFIEAANANAILFSWLKTVNTAFYHMQQNPPLTHPDHVRLLPSRRRSLIRITAISLHRAHQKRLGKFLTRIEDGRGHDTCHTSRSERGPPFLDHNPASAAPYPRHAP